MSIASTRRPRIYHNSLVLNKIRVNGQRNAVMSNKAPYKGNKGWNQHNLETRETREGFGHEL